MALSELLQISINSGWWFRWPSVNTLPCERFTWTIREPNRTWVPTLSFGIFKVSLWAPKAQKETIQSNMTNNLLIYLGQNL